MTTDRSLIYPNYKVTPLKGEQCKCEECGLETLRFWKSFFLSITGRKKPKKATRWHYMHEVEWKDHPKYSKKPYYYQEYDRFNDNIYPLLYPRFWLCDECFLKACEEEKELERESWSKYHAKEREFEKNVAKKFWENPRKKPWVDRLTGDQLQAVEWFKKHEGKKVQIYYDSSDLHDNYNKAERIIECPDYSDSDKEFSWFSFRGSLRIPDESIDKVRIEESQIYIHRTFNVFGEDLFHPESESAAWTIKLI